jgi:hypothetical protein
MVAGRSADHVIAIGFPTTRPLGRWCNNAILNLHPAARVAGVFDDVDAVANHRCGAWNRLEAQQWTIMAIALRRRANGFLTSEPWYNCRLADSCTAVHALLTGLGEREPRH